MFKAVSRYRRLYVAAVLVLFLSFAFNVFGVGATGWFFNFQKDSEALIVDKLACEQALGTDAYGGMLTKIKDGAHYPLNEMQPDCQKKKLEPYVSQYGLQGKVYEVAYKAMHSLLHVSLPRFLVVVQLFLALCTALTLGLFIIWTAEEFSAFTATFTLLLLSISTWIVGYARNLYWVTPLIFLPLVYTLFYYRRARLQKVYLLFLTGLCALFFIRFLNGYEFTPEIILAPVSATAFLIFRESDSLSRLLKEAVPLCVAGVIAFAAAFGLNYYQVYRYTGNGSQALQLIKERALARTADERSSRRYVYSGLQNTLPDVYSTINNYVDLNAAADRQPLVFTNALSFLNYMLLPVISVPFIIKEPLATIVNSFLFVAVLSWLAIKKLAKGYAKSKDAEAVRSLALKRTLWVGLISSLSWLVLAHSHSLVHAHLDGIIFYLPFMLFAYIALGLWAEATLHKMKLRLRNRYN